MLRQKGSRFVKYIAFFVFFIIFLSIFIPSFFTVVDAGEVGVYSLFGKVNDEPLYPGFNFKIPFARITKMSTRTEDYTMTSVDEDQYLTSTSGSNDPIEVKASDGATVWLDITVLYRLQPEKAPEIYKTVGTNYSEVIVRPIIRSEIREVAAKYSVTEIYSTKRDEIQTSIFEGIKENLEGRGIVIEEALLRKVNLSATLSDSIELKLAAEQNVEKEKLEAERKKIEAEGQKNAQQIIAQGLTPNYLYYLYIQNLKDNTNLIYVPINPENGMPLFKEVE